MKRRRLLASLGALGLTSAFAAAGWSAGSTAPFKDLGDLEKLSDVFNRDKGDIRLVTLLSPSCAYCIKGYRYVRKILEEVPDPRLKVYVVWEPMLSGDSRELAEQMSRKTDDPRVVHQSWDGGQISGKAWQQVLQLKGVAWDVYFLYGPDATWSANGPTRPDYWEHQGQSSRDNWLNYKTLKGKVEELLSRPADASRS